MEPIQTALQHAYQAKPMEFKDSIVSALEDKLSDALMMRKMSFASTVLKHDDESSEEEVIPVKYNPLLVKREEIVSEAEEGDGSIYTYGCL